MPQIAITIGDPSGIGPEIVCRALAKLSPTERESILVIGRGAILARANGLVGAELHFSSHGLNNTVRLVEVDTPKVDTIRDGEISEGGGHAAYGYVTQAVDLALSGDVRVLVTAPLNKAAMHLAGHKYDGHTGLLQHLTKAPSSFMLLTSEQLSTIQVSTHVSLAEAIKQCKRERILETIHAGNTHFRDLGVNRPRIAVAGLNPHSGERGIFGREEIEQIEPAIAQARADGVEVSGPYSADTIFYRAANGEFDLVVAQYHDQGITPIKLIAFDKAVNVSLGLPIQRTSVDHGTAFDIAWKGHADHSSMLAAIAYARRIAAL